MTLPCIYLAWTVGRIVAALSFLLLLGAVGS